MDEIRKVLNKLADLDGIDYSDVDQALAQIREQIIAFANEIIGEDDDETGYWEDSASGRNALRTQLRAEITKRLGK